MHCICRKKKKEIFYQVFHEICHGEFPVVGHWEGIESSRGQHKEFQMEVALLLVSGIHYVKLLNRNREFNIPKAMKRFVNMIT